jgi:hypothetical protein
MLVDVCTVLTSRAADYGLDDRRSILVEGRLEQLRYSLNFLSKGVLYQRAKLTVYHHNQLYLGSIRQMYTFVR